ncbi:MAG: hypothetical protein ABJK25_11120 [Halieaceae bacterium]
MNSNFKPLGLAVAVAAVSAGYAGVAGAQATVERSIGNLGDTAIVPYYTVQDDWVTGIHIINTSKKTQVVKLRLRRATDSADALDFNLILSPKDEWTGSISDETGNIVVSTDDASCTAPIRENGDFPMSPIYRLGAEEGYIEVITMGAPTTESAPIAIAAKHKDGVPRDCGEVASNFFSNVGLRNDPFTDGTLADKGVIDYDRTHQEVDADSAELYIGKGAACLDSSETVTRDEDLAEVCANFFDSEENALKVSYFFRDAASGIEFGGDAVHLSNFSTEPWMTNQETGLFSGDPYGFDYPDLDGGPWVDAGSPNFAGNPFALRYQYNALRSATVLGVTDVLNDWSIASARNVSTDWVVTMPGQYAMLDQYVWLTQGLDDSNCGTTTNTSSGTIQVPECNFRDIPVTADLTLYDREEGQIVPEDGDLVISPQPPGERNELQLPYEVNVVEWTDGANTPVLGSAVATSVDASALGDFGWASLEVTSASRVFSSDQSICQYDIVSNNVNPDLTKAPIWNTAGQRATCIPAAPDVPVVGFVAWERSFPQNPDGNYGRLIDHSFELSSS